MESIIDILSVLGPNRHHQHEVAIQICVAVLSLQENEEIKNGKKHHLKDLTLRQCLRLELRKLTSARNGINMPCFHLHCPHHQFKTIQLF